MSDLISIDNYELHVIDGKPMIKDLDLAKKLGFSRPTNIRKNITRMLSKRQLKAEEVCSTVEQTTSLGGRPASTYYLDEKATLKVITKSETENADAITDEMIEVFIKYRSGTLQPIQQEPVFDIPKTYAGALRLAADKMEENERLEQEKLLLECRVEEDAPKVEFYDEFVNKDGLYTLQNAGRALQQRPNKFIQSMKGQYLFYQGTALVAKVQYIQQGIFEVKSTIIDDKARLQTYVTPKGIQYFAKKLSAA
ncbi:phage antirepressor KilAC domain-containing protein [Agarilytica rhodophyticola]|uniref:phage antirepressor KilAC domain-containing protein n=1 Tax=Agarilytica rhodophyticola TaxID=1737490 RepID=UPI000B349FB0|nr:phage antirepressor KilAC domain-containing protein [Agarilytica rhodophyticola]